MKLLIVVLFFVTACSSGTVDQSNVPPAGQVWFGTSFDPKTFVITDRRTTIGTQEGFAMVAHLVKPTDMQGTTIRASLNGNLVNSVATGLTTSGDVFGLALTSVVMPGQWRYDIVDVGGNVLASGTVTAS